MYRFLWIGPVVAAGVLAATSFGAVAAQAVNGGRVPGWPDLAWGMDLRQVARALPRAQPLAPAWDFGPLTAPLMVPEVTLGGVPFRVFFQMDAAAAGAGGLRQVLFENRRAVRSKVAVRNVIDALEDRYGPPDAACQAPGAEQGLKAVSLTWRTPAATIHASFLDMLTTNLLFRDPSRDVDPLRTWEEEERIERRFLPRRITVRFHAPIDRALDPPVACVP